jgi:hypothetical protein
VPSAEDQLDFLTALVKRLDRQIEARSRNGPIELVVEPVLALLKL